MKSNSKGSSTVFLGMVLSSMIILVMAIVQIAIRISGDSIGQGVMLLSGRSLLSEYDKNLKADYGLFAFRGSEGELESKMNYYSEGTFEKSPYYKLGKINISSASQKLSDPKIFKAAIIEYSGFAIAKDLFSQKNITASSQSNIPGRVLRNRHIIESLPSYHVGTSTYDFGDIADAISQWDQVFQKGTEQYLINQYIMMYFNNAYQHIGNHNTFFNNEAEYILKGNYDDDKNKKLFRQDLLMTRNAINLGVLMIDPTLRSQVIAAANVISPGPFSIATFLLVAEAWSLAEAENDVRVLEHGKKIPLNKNSTNWAIDIQSIIAGTTSGYIDTPGDSGLNYENYLQIFLFFENETTKMTRMMDLMQINIQGNYDKTFLIDDHQTGIIYDAQINHFTVRGETKY